MWCLSNEQGTKLLLELKRVETMQMGDMEIDEYCCERPSETMLGKVTCFAASSSLGKLIEK